MRHIFSDRGRLEGILAFEAALAESEAHAGVIPSSAAQAILARCDANLFDHVTLARGTQQAGNSAIPVVHELTKLVQQTDPEAARYVHWAATSQDAMDTGLVLQLRSALELIEIGLATS